METYPTITIRAPCLFRVIKIILSSLPESIRTPFLQTADDEKCKNEGHYFRKMYEHMNTEQTTPPHFPTTDMNIMGKLVLKLIKLYKNYPKLYHTLAFQSSYGQTIFASNPRNSRISEIENLNRDLKKMADVFTDQLEPSASTTTCHIDSETLFHPDSHFMSLTFNKLK